MYVRIVSDWYLKICKIKTKIICKYIEPNNSYIELYNGWIYVCTSRKMWSRFLVRHDVITNEIIVVWKLNTEPVQTIHYKRILKDRNENIKTIVLFLYLKVFIEQEFGIKIFISVIVLADLNESCVNIP